MSRKPAGEQRVWKILLLIHIICYEIFFIYSIDGFKFGASFVHDYFIILLFWTPILLLHVGATYYYGGRADLSRLEREAYRDGFADAVRQLGSHPDAIERLALDDEGELVEMPVQPSVAKRKRRFSGEDDA